MSLTTLLVQTLLTVPLTFIINYFQVKNNRRINQILFPSIYTILLAALIPSIKQNIFLIVIFEIFIRNFYISNITNQSSEISGITFIFESLASIILSLFVYNYFISKVDSVIPNPEDIKGFIWFLIIIYISYIYKFNSKEKVDIEKNKVSKRTSEKTIMQYAKFKNQYSMIVKSKNELINNLVYAIMIYEDYKTPKFYRNINAYIGAITKCETKYGIMQIPSYERISDEESIKKVISNFEKQLKNSELNEEQQINKLLSTYKQHEMEEIIIIYKEIIEFIKK